MIEVRTFMATYTGQTAPRRNHDGMTHYIRLRFIDDETGQAVYVTCVLHPSAMYFVLNTVQAIRMTAGLPQWESSPDVTYKTLQAPLAGCKGTHVRLEQYAHPLRTGLSGRPRYGYRVAS